MKKQVLLLVVVSLLLFQIGGEASAHVFVKESRGQSGAILHINPDDDPVAGEESNLFYDIQNPALKSGGYKVKLEITNDKAQTVDVPINISENSVSTDYIFPLVGVYKIKLAITTAEQNFSYEYSQRVSRGVKSSSSSSSIHNWAQVLLVTSGVVFVFQLIFIFNRRKEILRQSKW